MKFKQLAITLSVALATVAGGLAHAQDFKPRIIRFGYGLNEDSNQGRAVKLFAQEVEKASGGKMRVRAIGARVRPAPAREGEGRRRPIGRTPWGIRGRAWGPGRADQ